MANELYVYNGTNQQFDPTVSVIDMSKRENILIPPGSQAKLTLASPGAMQATVAHLERYGAVAHDKIDDPEAFAGISHSAEVISIPKKPTQIVHIPVPAQPKGK